MENHREETIVIFAGYPDKMEEFIRKNPGLRSRIAFHVPFEDYSAEELTEIADLMAGENDITLTEEAREKIRSIAEEALREIRYPAAGDVFERIVDYILISNARIFSAKSISDYMKGHHISVSVPTVIKYLGYLKEAYVIEDVPIYSSKAKARLNYYFKLYDADVSLNSIRVSGNRYDLTHNLENM